MSFVERGIDLDPLHENGQGSTLVMVMILMMVVMMIMMMMVISFPNEKTREHIARLCRLLQRFKW